MQTPRLLLVYTTLLFALLCQLFPWTGQGVILRPDFMLVVLVYWLLRAPHLCHIGTAWIVGILVDLATGSLLGQHALAFTLTAYVALSFQRRLVLYTATQITFYVLGLLFFSRLIILTLKLFAGNEAPSWDYFLPVITGILLWQVLRVAFGSLARPKSSRTE
ncbi:MAG TPA: rod shape-determining protein MreD [Methylophilaceae bacterium]|nr:rod shape-determining protein MreD [Methylophilaceae bacterium]